MFHILLKTARHSVLVMAMMTASSLAGADTGAMIEQAMVGNHRSDAYKARNQYRHPKQTLLFFGLTPDKTVVEITPGRGWYSEILGPVLSEKGIFYPAGYRITEDSRSFFRRMDADLRAKIAASPGLYRSTQIMYFDRKMPEFAPPGSADLVLTFRNVHNWAKAGSAETMFRGFYAALKPGGVLGVVEHRAKPGTLLQQQIQSGYMTEDYVINLAEKAGFRLDAKSQINANPKDTADHPGGVWNLMPSLRNVSDEDLPRIRAIGESDRMTIRFVKPRN